jgi:hypothetical protein
MPSDDDSYTSSRESTTGETELTTPDKRTEKLKDCPQSAKDRVDLVTSVSPLVGNRSIVTHTSLVVEYAHVVPRATASETVSCLASTGSDVAHIP